MIVGYLVTEGDQISAELDCCAASSGFVLQAIDATSLEHAAHMGLAALIVPGACLDRINPETGTPQVPIVFLPADDLQTSRALLSARPCDEICGASEPLRLRIERVRRTVARHMSTKLNPLTGLFNPASFEISVQDWLRQTSREQSSGLFMLDVDHFNAVSGRYGHTSGDDVLRQLATRLRALPGVGLVTRYGGEEFVWVAAMADFTELTDLAERAIAIVTEHEFSVQSQFELPITASVGWTILNPGDSLSVACQRADMALYQAKSEGRNRVVSHHGMSSELPRSEIDMELLHFQNVAKVVTERTARLVSQIGKGLVERARTIADRDPLTGAWNRGYLDRRLGREMDLSRRDGRPLAIAMMDLDHFGRFNKDHGTPTGDAVLRAFVRLAEGCLRATDWVARYGGEEFVLVVPGSAADAWTVADRLRSVLAATQIDRPAKDGYVQVTVSIGISAFDGNMSQTDALFQRASDALNEAKRAGRNRVLVAG